MDVGARQLQLQPTHCNFAVWGVESLSCQLSAFQVVTSQCK